MKTSNTNTFNCVSGFSQIIVEKNEFVEGAINTSWTQDNIVTNDNRNFFLSFSLYATNQNEPARRTPIIQPPPTDPGIHLDVSDALVKFKSTLVGKIYIPRLSLISQAVPQRFTAQIIMLCCHMNTVSLCEPPQWPLQAGYRSRYSSEFKSSYCTWSKKGKRYHIYTFIYKLHRNVGGRVRHHATSKWRRPNSGFREIDLRSEPLYASQDVVYGLVWGRTRRFNTYLTKYGVGAKSHATNTEKSGTVRKYP